MKCQVCKKEIELGSEHKIFGKPYNYFCSDKCCKAYKIANEIMKEEKIGLVCNKCGNIAVPIKEKDWAVYKNIKCKCGGRFELKIL